MTITTETATAHEHSAPNTAPTPAPAKGLYAQAIADLSAIVPNPHNPRTRFDDAALAELADSIRALGILEPIIVRPVKRGDDWLYEIIAGERRWRAAKLAGLARIPVLIHQADDDTAARIALVENVQREDLDPIEEARAYARLNREHGMRQAAIATAVGRSQPAIANTMRLLDLPDDVQARISRGELTTAHGVALARFKAFPDVVSKIAELTVSNQATAKELAKGLPWGWELGELVRGLHTAGFDTTVCRSSCPYGAYVEGYCLKPEHAKELERDTERAIEERTTAAIAAAKARGEVLLKLEDLTYGTYERIWGSETPPGCSAACECRATAISRDGRTVQICVGPKRMRSLRSAETRRENKAAADVATEKAAQLDQALRALAGVGPRELAILAAFALAHVGYDKSTKAVAEAHGLDPSALPTLSHDVGGTILDYLSGFPTLHLVRVAIDALCRAELANPHRQRIITWYLGDQDSRA
ncbi:MAG: ParB/RepB/Spo0J family partition protein [Thermoleophilia bacterium]|nr:ParB/RepB/Spo0J family partition protein [Thermoleophilia bacterium]